jgi:type IV pilus assembly protein PilM
MATKQPGTWGIDLGQCALKAIRLERIDGQVTATAFDYIEHPKILSQPDADPDQLVREALEKFLSRNDLRGDMVAISVPGQSGLARFVKLPPVEEKKINDIVRFEAKQQIPFPLEEVVWDFQKIGSGTVTDGFALDTEVGLFAMKRDLVNRYLQHFKDVGVEIHYVQMAPLSLCNFLSFDLLAKQEGEEGEQEDEEGAGKKQCVVALDIGADSSNLVITDGERIIWQRPIPLGGNHFTRALTKDLKLTFAKAEHVKRTAVKSPDLRKILAALKPVLNDFVSEVQRSLGYFTNTHRDAHVKYMVGLGNAFRLPGLQKYLQEKLQLEVRKLQRLNRLAGESVTSAPQLVENLPSFAVAYGLALQGLDVARVHTNLLPGEIRFERLVRAKKPWAAAAAAALVLAVAGLTFGRSAEWRAVENDAVKKAINEGKKVLDQANSIKKQWSDYDTQVKENIKAVNRIASGVDERFNWNLLFKYVNDALPQPYGNKRLGEDARTRDRPKEKYDTDKAAAAYAELLKKQFVAPGAPVPKAEKEREIDNLIKKYLIQINIEGIDSEWSDDLTGFYKKLAAEKDNLFEGMDPTEKPLLADPDKLPKSGWVVEIRGSTYHEDGSQFVVNTLVENLARPEKVGNDYAEQAKQLKAKLDQVDARLKTLNEQLKQLDEAKTAADQKKAETKADEPKQSEGKKQPQANTKADAQKRAQLLEQKRLEEHARRELDEQWKAADQLKKGVQDRIKLIFLYKAQKEPTSLAQTSVLPGLLAEGASATGTGQVPGAPAMSMPPGAAGSMPNMSNMPGKTPTASAGTAESGKSDSTNRAAWVPLGEIAASALSSRGAQGAMSGTASKEATPVPAQPQSGGTTSPHAGRNRQPRTDFVVLFVWREPLPTSGGDN